MVSVREGELLPGVSQVLWFSSSSLTTTTITTTIKTTTTITTTTTTATTNSTFRSTIYFPGDGNT